MTRWACDTSVAIAALDPTHEAECWLDAAGMRDLRERLAALDIVGGSVYDALVGQACVTNGRTLLTRDRLEVSYRFVD